MQGSMYIGGEWVPARGQGALDVVNPTTEEVIGSVPAGDGADVAAAVAAAGLALPAWSATSPDERRGYLSRMAEGLAERRDEVARLIATEVGSPLKFATAVQAGLPVTIMGSFAELVGSYPFEERIGNSLVVREPVGVVGAITPWNYPLHQVVAKLAPALAAGCVVVLKPSEVAPLTTRLLVEIAERAGLPPGVFNVVYGTGPQVGE